MPGKEEEEKGMMQKKEEEEEEGMMQRKGDGTGGHASASLNTRIENSSGGGKSMPPTTLKEMSTSFGKDFSNVNIHTDVEAAQMNKELGAQAYADVLKTSKLRDHGPEFEMVKRVVTNLTRVADDPGFDWEVHPAYRWALQPDDLTSIFDHLVLTAD